MEPRNNNTSENQDFTSKGRVSNTGKENGGFDNNEPSDISHVDQQEGELKHGTTGRDEGLFNSSEDKES